MPSLPFEIKPCRQECGQECGSNLAHCTLYNQLPEQLQAICTGNLHVLRYLQAFPIDKFGMPKYYDKLSRSLKGTKDPNLIYPVSKEVFIHILLNSADIRNFYIPIEPSPVDGYYGFLDEIEERLADFVEELADITDITKRIETVMKIVDRLIVVSRNNDSTPPAHRGNGGQGDSTENGRKRKGKIMLTPIQYFGLRYLLERKLDGMGILEPMIRDTNIEDISCSGLGNIFVEHKVFGGLKASIGFDNHAELDKFVLELSEGIKRPVTFREPCVDAVLHDGSRINIVYGTDVSKRGSNFTIRKFSDTPLSVLELIQFGALDYEMAAYLSLLLQEGMNVWVSGETASGKTTLLNCLTTFIPPDAKIVSIEDTPEVQVPHHNWIRGVTRGSAKDSDAAEVSMFDLLKAALRQRPNFIIIGEIRGAEGSVAFQAMQTGHACMSTFHASSVAKLIQRLTGNPINVPKTYVDNLNVVVITQLIRLAKGGTARRVTSISEIVSYDSVADSFSFIEVFTWNPLTDTFDFRGYQNSYLLEFKIAPRRGLSQDNRRQIYKTLKQRADVLRRIHEQKITDFYEVNAILSKAYRDGYFR